MENLPIRIFKRFPTSRGFEKVIRYLPTTERELSDSGEIIVHFQTKKNVILYYFYIKQLWKLYIEIMEAIAYGSSANYWRKNGFGLRCF